MGTLYESIMSLCDERGIKGGRMCVEAGISKGLLTDLKMGRRSGVSAVTAQKIADYFGITVGELLNGKQEKTPTQTGERMPDNILPMPKMKKVPLVGSIACGAPILAAENIEGEVDIPENINADFALRCKGDSMINARIFDGDIVYIKQQDTVDNGQIAAVLIEDEATLKRVRLYPDHISLEPENPMYKPMVFWEEEMNAVRIIGKAVAFTSPVI